MKTIVQNFKKFIEENSNKEFRVVVKNNRMIVHLAEFYVFRLDESKQDFKMYVSRVDENVLAAMLSHGNKVLRDAALWLITEKAKGNPDYATQKVFQPSYDGASLEDWRNYCAMAKHYEIENKRREGIEVFKHFFY